MLRRSFGLPRWLAGTQSSLRYSTSLRSRRQHKVLHPSRDARPGTPPSGEAKRNPRSASRVMIQARGAVGSRYDCSIARYAGFEPFYSRFLGFRFASPQGGVPSRASRLGARLYAFVRSADYLLPEAAPQEKALNCWQR